MAKVLIEETTLTAIGDAIRGKEGTTDLVPVNDMAARIEALNNTVVEGTEIYEAILDGTVTRLEKADFRDITNLRPYAISNCKNLTYVDLADSIETIDTYVFYQLPVLTTLIMPRNIKKMAATCFSGCNKLTSITLFETPPTIYENTFVDQYLKTIYVPGEALDVYYAAPYWGGIYKDRLVPNSKYVGNSAGKILEFGGTATVTIPLKAFNELPNPTITANVPSAVSISNINCTLDDITFDVTAAHTEGEFNVIVSVPGDNGYTFERELPIKVFAELTPSTWEVVPVEGVTYGFKEIDDGWWESTNQTKPTSFAMCQVNISNMLGYTVVVECINSGEANYDYGILSNKDQTLGKNANLDSSYKTMFKGLSSQTVIREVSYDDLIGDCFITIKFRKDGSGDSYNDSIRFRVRFE